LGRVESPLNGVGSPKASAISASPTGAVVGTGVTVGVELGVDAVWLTDPLVRKGGEPATTMADALVRESASTSATSTRVVGRLTDMKTPRAVRARECHALFCP
jgi:hypothetical protein